MNTAAIINPTVTIKSAAPKASATNSSAPDESFNQVMSREMSDRNNAAANSNAQVSEKKTASPKTQSSEDTQSKPAEDKAETSQSENSTSAMQLLVLVSELNAANATAASSADATAASSADSGTEKTAAAVSALSADTGTKSDPALLITAQDSQEGNAISSSTDAAQLAEVTTFAETVKQISNSTPKAATSIAPTQNQTFTEASQAITVETSDAKLAAMLPTTANQPSSLPAAITSQESDALTAMTADAHNTNAVAMAPLHQATLSNTQTAGTQTDKLTPQVGTPDWNQALGQKVVWMANSAVQSASLTLNPPDLGPLQVVLSVSNNQASASFVATQPEVRQALEAALPRLREMLGDAGIQLGQANVSAGTPQQQGSSHFEQQQMAASATQLKESTIVMPTSTASSSRVVHQGLVDTFA